MPPIAVQIEALVAQYAFPVVANALLELASGEDLRHVAMQIERKLADLEAAAIL